MKAQTGRKGMAAVGVTKPVAAKPPLTPATLLEVDVEGRDGRRKYQGKFPYNVPTIGNFVDIAARKAQYLQELPGSSVDPQGANYAEMLSYLHVTVGDTAEDDKILPAWWKDSRRGIDLYDHAPLLALYAAARAYEATFLLGDDDQGDAAESDGQEPEAPGDGPVVSDVQPAAERRQVIATLGEGGA